MKRLLVSLLLMAPATELHAANPTGRIAVYLYNFGEVPGDVLVRATQEVSRIFNRAGIALEWVDCPTRPGLEEQYPRCAYTEAKPKLELRLLSRAIAERMGLDPTVFGVALYGQNGRLGSTAYAVIGAEIELWQGCNLDRGTVLGHLIAHELGHLLLGERSHASCGVNRPVVSGAKTRARGMICDSGYEAVANGPCYKRAHPYGVRKFR